MLIQRWMSLGITLLAVAVEIHAATNTNESAPRPGASLDVQEKAACSNNLTRIHQAIQAYQRANRDLPNWLSDLVPKFLSDPNTLTCPVCRRTGRTESPPLADPKLSSSYLFEFCPVPLGTLLPDSPERTRRDWKRRQMGLVGSAVPMVRCRHHKNALNLAFDGKVYESPGQWELAFTNQVILADLQPPALFAGEAKPRFPTREPTAGAELINLGPFYNVALDEPWQGATNGSLDALPKGLQKLAGTQFDLRGIVQLSGRNLTNKPFAAQVKNIPVNQRCRRLHFLHAVAFGNPSDEGKQVGSYFVQFADNPARIEIPVVYGKDLRGWRPAGNEGPGPEVAWNGQVEGKPARLFKMTWVNLAPEAVIAKIDFVSNPAGPAPFLVAVTAE